VRVRATLLVLVIAACGRGSPSSSTSDPGGPADVSALSPLLAAVGPAPRGFASLVLTDPAFHDQLTQLQAALRAQLGSGSGDCGTALSRLERLRIAVGEPLRIAAELDGQIDARAVACLLGEADVATLARSGLVLRDRPGGVAIEYQADRGQAERARRVGGELMRRCGSPSCAVLMLGPASARLWVQYELDQTMRMTLSGPSFGHAVSAANAALDALRKDNPAMGLLTLREQHGDLVAELPKAPSSLEMVFLALTLRGRMLEAFKIPSSSMAPTVLVDDHLFIVKGALTGEVVPGDVLVYKQDDVQWIKRYIAGPGQTIAETDTGLVIDGQPLATEVVDPNYRYRDGEKSLRIVERTGTVVREHLGARSYLTLRTGPPRQTGSWTVPAGHVFLIGDNRNNSNDSRYVGPTRKENVVGRAVFTWLAYRDGVPDWDRMGVSPE